MAHIILRGWIANANLRPISVIKTIKDHTGKNLGDAKRTYDNCLSGKSVEIHGLHEDQAKALYHELRQLSFAVDWSES